MHTMKKLLLVLVCLLLIAGCNPRKAARANLLKLQIGMNKGQVLEIMGKPVLTEASNKREIWYYITGKRGHGPFTTGTNTPLLIVDNKLVGWGPNSIGEATP